jgi:hypothetical protein
VNVIRRAFEPLDGDIDAFERANEDDDPQERCGRCAERFHDHDERAEVVDHIDVETMPGATITEVLIIHAACMKSTDSIA